MDRPGELHRAATVSGFTGLANDERFPVVDQNDKVLRDASRSDVHGNNLRHRAVHILIFNSVRRSVFTATLALERSASSEMGLERCWSCRGGRRLR